MERDEVIDFLQKRLDKLKETEPGAFNSIAAYEYVINDVAGED